MSHSDRRRVPPRQSCKDPFSISIPDDYKHPEFACIRHPKNLIHAATGIALLYDPVHKGWLRWGCGGVKEPSAATHIWSQRDAVAYLDRVVAELRAGKIHPARS